MAFSQELKIEAFRRGFRCAELPITYRPRGGETKINTMVDGMRNMMHLIGTRIRPLVPVPPDAAPGGFREVVTGAETPATQPTGGSA